MPQYITFTTNGLQLEGMFTPPQSQRQARGLVLCHPHPLRGGDMENTVIRALDDAFATLGFGVLRFNFRGVGDSQGHYDEGIGEQEDVKGAIAWLAGQTGIEASRTFLAGYSFGARVALHVAAGAGQIGGFIAVAPVLRGGWPSFEGQRGPKLIICGDADPHASPEMLVPWVEHLPEPKRLIVLPNADHFFFGHERFIGQQAVEAFQALSGP